jgi:hypothetical protein
MKRRTLGKAKLSVSARGLVVARIEEAAPKGAASGLRYPAPMMTTIAP